MTRRRTCAALVIAIAAAATLTASPAVSSLSVDEFAAALSTLEGRISSLDPSHPAQAAAMTADVPRSWSVTASDGRSFEVSGAWLRQALSDWKSHPDAVRKADLLAHLTMMRRDALGYERAPADVTSTRDALTRILAQREFDGLGPPSWWARLKARVLQWLENLVVRVLGSSAMPTVTQLVVYGLAVVAVIAVFVWIVRLAERRAAIDPAFQPPAAVPSDRPWSAWLDAARAASADGQWRDAIHLAYWCGISFLESQHAWRPDASRTPREYTRAFKDAGARGDALKQFTTLLERVWYAGDTADARSFDQALTHLGALGCPAP